MKTIEITDEQYEFLKQAQSLLKTQDNRLTRDPLYCVMKKERIYGLSEEYASDSVWVFEDTTFETVQDLYNDVIENFEDQLKKYTIDYYGIEGEADFSTLAKNFVEDVEESYYVYEDFLNDLGYYKVYYNEEHKLDENSNIFSLFEVDAQEFVDSKYGTDSKLAYSYACSSWRASRMNKVRDFLLEVKL